jgi:hypothetical protein
LNLFENCVAKSSNGHEINVQIIPLKRKQNVSGGQMWVIVGNKILLESGKEIEFNLDGKSFYISPNQMYKLVC